MGACLTKNIRSLEDPTYPQHMTLNIKDRSPNGKSKTFTRVSFSPSIPCVNIAQQISVRNYNFHLSACVLPGLDPRGNVKKQCEDGLFFVEQDSSLLIGLFDGHGIDGRKVVEFCTEFFKNYYRTEKDSFENNPQVELENMIVKCDEDLRESDIDVSTSGSTVVLVLVTETGFYAANVGDSKAVLATKPKENEEIKQIELRSSRFKREIIPNRVLAALPLTIDSKPNHATELERITKCGGRVQQLNDEFGVKIGPYRV